MKNYTVRYEETSVMYYPVEADSEKDAMAKFRSYVDDGKIDFNHMGLIKSVMTAKEV